MSQPADPRSRPILRPRRNLSMIAGLLLVAAAVLPNSAEARTESVLYSFQGGGDGDTPFAGLALDFSGNLYGTTTYGGHGYGTVFELSRNGGGWVETILHNFESGTDGANPYGSLILDAAGNLYGTTGWGGTTGCENIGCGTVFKLYRKNDVWKEKILYRFAEDREGEFSLAGLARDGAGNLYGTAAYGGSCGSGATGNGTVFELSPTETGWSSTVLNTFCDQKLGYGPSYGSLVLDNTGNVYGAAGAGGMGYGTIFQLSNPGGTGWKYAVLHTFTAEEGGTPVGGVILDGRGNVYGAAAGGGVDRHGTIFELLARKSWKMKVLHTFAGADGDSPFITPIFDSSGNLYGTTYSGGTIQSCYDACGLVYELAPTGRGEWDETVLFQFGAVEGDGYQPLAGVALDSTGNLYGTTTKGGAGDFRRCDCGVVYRVASAARKKVIANSSR
jgi:uncharacterized repeat protein (TIGR03803 family)